jgi:hypothetical protein
LRRADVAPGRPPRRLSAGTEEQTLALRDLGGLSAIGDLHGLRRRIVVFLGERAFRTDDGIDALPVRDFLEQLEDKKI